MSKHRVAEAIAHHVWVIAACVRGASDDPARQARIAANVGEALILAIEYQEKIKAPKEGVYDS